MASHGHFRSADDLNFFLKRFAPRIRLRLAPDAVIAAISDREMRVPATISFVREGRGAILGIGDDPIDTPNAVTVRLFTAAGLAEPEYDDLLDKFLRLVFRRVPARSASLMRPVIILEGLHSLPADISDRVRHALLRALPRSGVVAVIIGDGH